MRRRLSNKWYKAQIMHTLARGSPQDQGHTIVRMMWKAMDKMWKAQNLMEHGTTTEERSFCKITKLNERLVKAYQEKHKLSQVARQQLFRIPLKRRK